MEIKKNHFINMICILEKEINGNAIYAKILIKQMLHFIVQNAILMLVLIASLIITLIKLIIIMYQIINNNLSNKNQSKIFMNIL